MSKTKEDSQEDASRGQITFQYVNEPEAQHFCYGKIHMLSKGRLSNDKIRVVEGILQQTSYTTRNHSTKILNC